MLAITECILGERAELLEPHAVRVGMSELLPDDLPNEQVAVKHKEVLTNSCSENSDLSGM